MSIIRVEKTKNYTVMSNHHLRNHDLSLKAKGLMSLMLSLPENWDYSVKGLVTLSKDKLDGVRSGLKELESQGYLKRSQQRDENGRMASAEYVLYENPMTENPMTENPMTENPTQINTKENKYLNKQVLTKESTKNIYSQVVDFLNAEAGTNYKSTTSKTQQLIKARLGEGFTFEDFETVIKKKCREWLDTDFAKYLRPETLFGTKFESYLNASEVKVMNRQAKSGSNVADEAVALLKSLGL